MHEDDLRDEIALRVLPRCMDLVCVSLLEPEKKMRQAAEMAYAMADAMIAQRLAGARRVT